ncbi:hypothetical protein Maq22A_c07650 [Methylobacterium aquaticum]|uniref:Uncharacterized protein n=1 Tax=Methylobacterium aquaticum TaxID=270351 RepID=A0A0C6F8Y3_9HYPH|nr:hypothetical protein Maq22A_c07650 [Methylobacterium aquaticum]
MRPPRQPESVRSFLPYAPAEAVGTVKERGSSQSPTVQGSPEKAKRCFRLSATGGKRGPATLSLAEAQPERERGGLDAWGSSGT